ncbi:MAG: anhydro-N-acetylmuramic acid kinase [Firmicutes bacterium]|nr:anhydro-N-acetylmuramic acid kinase [Bacillota bacterium]
MSGYAIGLMSGTSTDGIDAALIRVEKGHSPPLQLIDAIFKPFSREQRADIFRAFDPRCSALEWAFLHQRLGEWFAESVMDLLQHAGMSAGNIRVIGSHGQTVAHYPPSPDSQHSQGFSIQLGDPAIIAARTGIDVVHHFRAQDMAWGGQGAPLVPYFDYVIWRSGHESRAILNIGGIANVTLLPKDCTLDQVTAFDTGPGNMVLDALTEIATHHQLRYDPDGRLAREGRVDQELLQMWLSHPYFRQRPPKSTGREIFGEAYAQKLWNDGLERGLGPQDILRTATALVAQSIALAIEWETPYALVVSGGGIHNTTLMHEIGQRLSLLRPPESTDAYGFSGDMKEAVAFAYLAWEFCDGIPTNIPAVTGALRHVVQGSWTPARTGARIEPAPWVS